MDKKYTGAELPITTSNAALAFALYLAGAPFADDNAPLANLYDAEMLKGMGYTGPIEEAVAEAFAAGKKGHVEYSFARSENQSLGIAAYKKQQMTVDQDTREAADIVREIQEKLSGGRLTLAEAISASVCVILKRWRTELVFWDHNKGFCIQRNKHKGNNYDALEQGKKLFLIGDFYRFAALVMDAREVFLKLHLRYPPQIRFRHKGIARQSNGKTTFPGFAVLITGTPDNDTRKHLNLPTR